MSIGTIVSYFFFQLLVPFLFTLAVACFLWGLCLSTFAGGHDEELAERGKTVMLYGLLTLGAAILVYTLLWLIGGA